MLNTKCRQYSKQSYTHKIKYINIKYICNTSEKNGEKKTVVKEKLTSPNAKQNIRFFFLCMAFGIKEDLVTLTIFLFSFYAKNIGFSFEVTQCYQNNRFSLYNQREKKEIKYIEKKK